MINERSVSLKLIDEILFAPIHPLTAPHPVRGPGTYLLIYTGRLALYDPIAGRWPIYVGSSVSLSKRLSEHRRNLASVHDLDAQDFYVSSIATKSRYLAAYLEALGRAAFKPVWNELQVAGFGSRFQGRARAQQRLAAWSVLHPGRRCSGGNPLHTHSELTAIVTSHLADHAPPAGIWPFVTIPATSHAR